MSLESAKAFLERMKWDTELRKSIMKAEDRIEVVKNEGFDFTMEEWHQAREEHMKKQVADGELSEEELKKVAGGGCWCWDGWCWDV